MIKAIALLIADGEVAACGTLSPIPAAAMLFAAHTHAPHLTPLIYGDPTVRITDGLFEFFGLAQRGLIDTFFLSGIQIDRRGNINLSAIGDYKKPKIRLPGGAGSSMMYAISRRTILFTITHTPKLFVETVDFINASSSDGETPTPWRRGGPSHVVSPLCVMRFDEAAGGFILDSLLPGIPLETVVENTGFDLGIGTRDIPTSEPLTDEEIAIIRGPVLERLRLSYPLFVKMIWG
jgi:glutaconate CoA-transferase subunit B